MSNYRTNFDYVYMVNGYITSEEPTFSEDFMVAAVKEIYNGKKLTSRDKYVPEGCWVPYGPGCFEKAIRLRKEAL